MSYFEYDKQMGNTFTKYKHTPEITSRAYGYKQFTIVKKPLTKPIYIVNQDSLDTTKELLDKGFNPVVLNLANAIKPCWGQILGYSQEECLFRRSNLYKALNKKYYPLHDTLLYSPHIEIYLDPRYKSLNKPYNIDIITCAAKDTPVLIDGNLSTKDYQSTYDKIESIIFTAIKHKHDSIVLGAFGCGVFRNPPEQIAAIFKEILEKYGGHFKEIYFAVLSKGNDKNYEIFQRILSE